MTLKDFRYISSKLQLLRYLKSERPFEKKLSRTHPKTEKMTKPARKLVKQLMLLVMRASR